METEGSPFIENTIEGAFEAVIGACRSEAERLEKKRRHIISFLMGYRGFCYVIPDEYERNYNNREGMSIEAIFSILPLLTFPSSPL
jgi:hypothetical protein